MIHLAHLPQLEVSTGHLEVFRTVRCLKDARQQRLHLMQFVARKYT
jgi:hypothetical protein